jgi:predicted peptidase
MSPAPGDLPTAPGLHEIALQLDQQRVLATIVLPAAREGARPPLVLALHYAGHGAPHYATGYVTSLVAPGFEGLGAVIVAPDCPDRSWNTELSEKVVLSLLDLAVSAWKIDPERVVLTGYSMGAAGTWWLASRHPDRFEVAVPVAGRPQEVQHIAVPTYAVHGTADRLFPAQDVAQAVLALQGRGVQAHYAPGEGLGHYDTARYVPLIAGALPWISARLQD